MEHRKEGKAKEWGLYKGWKRRRTKTPNTHSFGKFGNVVEYLALSVMKNGVYDDDGETGIINYRLSKECTELLKLHLSMMA